MALDRHSIEKKDFPLGRRGYDPQAVDAHLSAIADEVAELRQAARRRSETIASSASEQVRAIVEAAEGSAAEIQHQAENDAREIRDEAKREADTTREEAVHQVREYVGSVSESTGAMLSRLDAIESELSGLIESLRTGAIRINADLNVLEGSLAEVRDLVHPRPEFEPDDEGAVVAGAAFAAEPTAGGSAFDAGRPGAAGSGEPPGADSGGPEPVGAESPAAEHDADVRDAAAQASSTAPTSAGPAEESDDAEGARLIALNMALNGTSRQETERYLTENFHLADPRSLLDEIYTSVSG